MDADDILPDFAGRVIHGFRDSCLKCDCDHAFGNARLLRIKDAVGTACGAVASAPLIQFA